MIIMIAYSIFASINLSFVIAIVLLFDSSCYFCQVKNYLRIYQRISHRNFWLSALEAIIIYLQAN